MSNFPHRIRRLCYLVSTSSQADAFAIRKCLRDRFSEELLPLLERAFDEIANGAPRSGSPKVLLRRPLRDRLIHIPKLELHLKVTSEQELMEVLPELIQQQLKEQLQLQSINWQTIPTTQPAVIWQETTAQQNQFDILLHYLQKGSVPWEAAYAATSDIAIDLKETCHQQWTQLLDYLHHQPKPAPFYFRLMQLIPQEKWLTLVNALSENIPQPWKTALVQLITSLLAAEPSFFSRHTQLQLTAAILSDSWQRRKSSLIPDFISLVDSLLSEQEKNQLHDFIASLPESAAILFEQKKNKEATPDPLDRQYPETFSEQPISQSQEAIEPSRSLNEEAAPVQLNSDDNATEALPGSPISESNERTEPSRSLNEEAVPSPLDRQSPEASSSIPTSESQKKSTTIPPGDSEIDQSNLDTLPSSLPADLLYSSLPLVATDGEFPLAVKYAGLVLIHPFLTRFLENTGVKEADNQELSAFVLPHAAALVHFLAAGCEEVYEYELGLIKVLLGLQPEIPLLVSSGLIEAKDREESEELLQAAISYWSVLKNTSVSGLRSSFLQRQGLLREVEGGWLLQVEPKPFDLLLNQLPWSISVIKLPWMKRPIYTEWPMP